MKQDLRLVACTVGLFILAVTAAAAATTVLPGLVRAPMSLPIVLPDGRQATLEGLVIRPERPGRFPLMVLLHGTPRGDGDAFFSEIARQSPAGLSEPAVAFAQRGYATVSIMRRGFGRSSGPYAEGWTSACDNRDYLGVGRAAGEDVAGAVATLRREPRVDPDRILLLGLSAGGFAATAAAATNPAGVTGILNFAGGRGSLAPDHSCSPDRLVEAVGVFGRTARVPALWIYSENDHYIGQALARRMFDSYVGAGGPARLEMLPPFGSDGHQVLLEAPSLWWPAVETFLSALHLPTSVIVEFPPLAALPPPAPLNTACTTYFDRYGSARTDAKAFAVNPEGHCASSLTARSLDEARQEAMTQCNGRWKDCRLYAAGQELVERAN